MDKVSKNIINITVTVLKNQNLYPHSTLFGTALLFFPLSSTSNCTVFLSTLSSLSMSTSSSLFLAHSHLTSNALHPSPFLYPLSLLLYSSSTLSSFSPLSVSSFHHTLYKLRSFFNKCPDLVFFQIEPQCAHNQIDFCVNYLLLNKRRNVNHPGSVIHILGFDC